MNSFAERLREAAAAVLPDGAFLKRDRADALFVTDAPRRRPDANWAERFAAAGFVCEIADGLARLTPGQRWLDALEARCPEPPDMFCASLARFAGREADPAALRLFAMGLRLLDGGRGGDLWEKQLRQRAAQCLRAGEGGGGLYACALLRAIINTGGDRS